MLTGLHWKKSKSYQNIANCLHSATSFSNLKSELKMTLFKINHIVYPKTLCVCRSCLFHKHVLLLLKTKFKKYVCSKFLFFLTSSFPPWFIFLFHFCARLPFCLFKVMYLGIYFVFALVLEWTVIPHDFLLEPKPIYFYKLHTKQNKF